MSEKGQGLLCGSINENKNYIFECRGVTDAEKWKLKKVFLKTQKMDLVCIQETMLKGISRDLVRSIGLGRFVDWVVVNAVGASRGILIF